MNKQSMQKDWNAYAIENAYHWVNSSQSKWEKDEYYQSGTDAVKKYVLPFFKKLGISKDKYSSYSALDIGCGTGRVCRALAQECAHVTGIDISEEMLQRARKDNEDIANITFIQTSGVDMEQIKNNSVDFCFSLIVFQHIPSKVVIRKYFQEIMRTLKPGGLAKIQVRGTPGNPPGKVIWFKGFQKKYFLLALWRGCIPLLWVKSYNTVFGACYKEKEFKAILESVGFKEVSTSYETDKYLWAELKKG